MKAVHNESKYIDKGLLLVIAHVKLQNESSSQLTNGTQKFRSSCDCSRKITK